MESKVRQLVGKLENVPTLVCAHPFTKGFEQISKCHNDDEVRMVATGDIPEEVAARTKLEDLPKKDEAAKEQDAVVQAQDAQQEGHRTIYTTTFYIGLCVEPKQANATGPRKLDISYPTNDFTRLVKQWEQYDDSSMGIVVRHIKCSQLPSYVFDGDERPPPKQLKRPKKGAAGAAAAGVAGAAAGTGAGAGVGDGSKTTKAVVDESTPPSKKRKSSPSSSSVGIGGGAGENGAAEAHGV